MEYQVAKIRIMQKVFCYLGAFCLIVSTAEALDLTPKNIERSSGEGPSTPGVQFTEQTGKIFYNPPKNWTFYGGGSSITFTASDGSQGWMKILTLDKKDPKSQPASPSPEDLQAWSARFIPENAQETTFIKSVPSPFTLGPLTCTEFIFSFVRYASRDMISISVVDYSEKERLVVIISSAAKDFEKVHATCISSLFSWEFTATAPSPKPSGTGAPAPVTAPQTNTVPSAPVPQTGATSPATAPAAR
jgi:hypothetical protein